MGYTKQNFENGQTLDAEHLNHIEDGIYQNSIALTTDKTLAVSDKSADAKAVGDLFTSQKRRISGFLNTNTSIDIDSTARKIKFGNQSFVSWGTERIDVSNKTYTLAEDLKWGGYLFFDPAGNRFVKTYEDGYIFVGSLWFPFWKHELHADRNRVFVDGMPVTFSGRYLNKTLNVLGDSMTEGTGLPGDTKLYHHWFPQLLGFDKNNVRNYGVGGSCISPKSDEVVSWDNVESFYERYSDMDNADVVIVFGGTNDWVYGHELGTISDTETNTFYGAMKSLCEGLLAKYPTADLYFFGSPQNDYINRRASYSTNDDGYNRKNHKLQDYTTAMGEVCAMYGIPFCDLSKNLWWGLSGVLGVYDSSGNGNHIAGTLGIDSLHPNAEGHKKIALKMADFINAN